MTQAFNLALFANKLNTSGQTDNTGLQNSSVTVTAGTGMSGGGAVALGSSVTLTNAGVTSIVAGSNITISGATGAVTINAAGGSFQTRTQLFTSSSSWTAPTGVTQVEVLVIAGGGGSNGYWATWGGGGGFAHALCTVVSGTAYTVTVGLGGNYQPANTPAPAGGASSFGSLVSATGGGGGPVTGGTQTNSGVNGTGTVSSGTAIRTGNVLFGKSMHLVKYTADPYYELFPTVGYIFTGSLGNSSNQTYTTSSVNPAGLGGNVTSSTGTGGVVFLRWTGV